MPYNSTVYRVMIASPSDVIQERKIAREIIQEWNSINSFNNKIVLMPIGWDTDSSPLMGNRPQEILNNQILDKCDLLLGIFWTRIGTPTGEAISGTVEEIEKHIKSGKPAMLYFSSVPVTPESIDQEQYNQLIEFRNECQSKGLYESFSKIEDFEKKFTKQLQLTINNVDFFKSDFLENSSPIDTIAKRVSEPIDISDEAQTIIKEASSDPNGQILKLRFLGGQLSIQTNGKNLINERNARIVATWEGALEELLINNYIEDVGYKNEVFRITREGYKYVDSL